MHVLHCVSYHAALNHFYGRGTAAAQAARCVCRVQMSDWQCSCCISARCRRCAKGWSLGRRFRLKSQRKVSDLMPGRRSVGRRWLVSRWSLGQRCSVEHLLNHHRTSQAAALSLLFSCDFWWFALTLSAMSYFCKVCPFSACLCICHVRVSDTTRMLLM